MGVPLWSSGHSSWLQIQRSGLDSRRYQIFWEVVGLEQGPLSLVSITEELLEWKRSGSSLENREYGHGDPLHWPRDTLYPQKLALTSPTSGGRSVSIVRLQAKATEFVLCAILLGQFLFWKSKNMYGVFIVYFLVYIDILWPVHGYVLVLLVITVMFFPSPIYYTEYAVNVYVQ
jgi:hypothetical protein